MMTKEDIKRIIPHRDPFLLIDEVTDMDMNAMCIYGRKYVSPEEYYFPGHFPDEPVVPGVIMVETMAQLGAVIILSMPAFKGKKAYFAGLESVRFKRKILPGETMDISVVIEKTKGVLVIGRGEILVGGEKACEGKIKSVIS